ncbi:hypothetical protein Sste5346_008763 [Sporothrix stenoceras]|uniref:Zn(2)-C6 fungal-type domain-containing protein n=1 Tax=Sporothrix stenoceras TaxID=5173 RepID=A0ABR3YMS0_9PEZI
MSTPQRTRTGCWTCRGRSVKCDEHRPICHKCSKAGLSCSYGMRLTWIEDSIARGTCHGREGLANKGRKKRMSAKLVTGLSLSSSTSTASGLSTSPSSTSSARQKRGVSPYHAVDPATVSDRTRHNTLFYINTSYDDVMFYLDSDADRCEPRHGKAKKARKDKSSQANQVDITGLHSDTISNVDYNDIELDFDLLPYDDLVEQELLDALAPVEPHTHTLDIFNNNNTNNNARATQPVLNRALTGRWAPLFGNIPAAESHLLDFYTAIVCSKATMLDERDHNPFRFILLPMAMSSRRVYYGLLAVAASKLAASAAAAASSSDTHNTQAHALALTYRQYALGGLRQFLSTIRPTEPEDLLEALAAAIPLCWFEVADHCQPTWTDHLAAIAALLEACTNHPAMPESAQDIVRFAWQYFAYHLVTAKTTFAVNQIIPSTSSLRLPSTPISSQYLHLRADTTRDSYVDAYQGFSNTLLFLIDDICELRNTPAAPLTQVAATVHRIEEAIVSLRQLPPKPYWFEDGDSLFNNLFNGEEGTTSPASDRSDSPHPRNSERTRFLVLESTAEAHRLGALLFLDETCALYWPEIVPRTRAVRTRLVDQIVDLSRAILAAEHVTAAFPVWAIFMAGCMATATAGGDHQRQRILDIFSRLEKTMFRSIPPARKVVEMVWRQQDLTVDENPRVATSWNGSFRTWKRADNGGGGQTQTQAEGGHNDDYDEKHETKETKEMKERRPRGGRAPSTMSANMGSCASKAAQFSWERAMVMLGESRLSLT